METTVEQTENLAEMAIRKKTVKRTKTRTARPRILRKRTLPKLKKHRKVPKKTKTSNAEKPISLKPLKFDDAVSALLKAKPEPKRHKEKLSSEQINEKAK